MTTPSTVHAPTAFADTVNAAIALLRELPRAPASTGVAREHLRAFSAAHASAAPEFLVDCAPGAEHADFDIYLAHPEGGTVALSYRQDAGRPWFVDYSEHWASNYVLLVGSQRVTIQEAMFAIQYLSDGNPRLVESLVRDALLTEFAASEPDEWNAEVLTVTDDELQVAADAFRRANGLRSAADTHAWLGQMGWSMHRFHSVLASGVHIRRIEERLIGGRIDAHFSQHHADYDIVQLVHATCADRLTADSLAARAREVGLMTAAQALVREGAATVVRAELVSSRAYELPHTLNSATPDSVVGPAQESGKWLVTHVLARVRVIELDTATRRVVRERLLRDWAATRATEVTVRWNWT